MSAAAIDAAMASAIEALFGAGTYRQQSDVREDRERVDPADVAYQLLVEELRENPQRGANESHRVYAIQTTIKKHVQTQADERTWRLGGMDAGRQSLLAREFYTGLGLDLYVADAEPAVTDTAEVVGRVMRFTVQTEVELAV